jgi:hypothetical protein
MCSTETFIPYQCVNLDISFSEIFEIQRDILFGSHKAHEASEVVKKVSYFFVLPLQIQQFWTLNPKVDLILPTLCVRSMLDLFFQVSAYSNDVKGEKVPQGI